MRIRYADVAGFRKTALSIDDRYLTSGAMGGLGGALVGGAAGLLMPGGTTSKIVRRRAIIGALLGALTGGAAGVERTRRELDAENEAKMREFDWSHGYGL